MCILPTKHIYYGGIEGAHGRNQNRGAKISALAKGMGLIYSRYLDTLMSPNRNSWIGCVTNTAVAILIFHLQPVRPASSVSIHSSSHPSSAAPVVLGSNRQTVLARLTDGRHVPNPFCMILKVSSRRIIH